MHLQIIVGSVREGRRSRAIADWALELASARADMSAELVDLKEWDLPMFNLARSPAAGAYEHPLLDEVAWWGRALKAAR
jgi:NAD(P)H-dependent FMN reductase